MSYEIGGVLLKLHQAKSLYGTLAVPADKSISHRSIMFGAIAKGETVVTNFLEAEDCLSTLKAFQDLGVSIERRGSSLKIQGAGFKGFSPAKEPLDMGNSGTTTRLIMGILANQPFQSILVGDDSLSKRPMNRVIDPLKQMNAKLTGKNESGYAPITISPSESLQPIHYTMPVASAQVKSAILFAALQADGESTIIEKEPSRNHTEEMIKQFGGTIEVEGKTIKISGPQELTGQTVTVPGDISSAAFFLVAGAIGKDSRLVLKNVGVNPTRTGILDVLNKMGARLTILNEDTHNQAADIEIRSSKLVATEIGGEIIPRLIDEIPVIALLATQAKGTTIIKNAEELKVKETNRIDATANELRKLGANIEPTADGLIIYGPTKLHGGHVSSHGDHRIGMMLQIAALLTDETIELEHPEAVSISYPQFFTDFERLITEED